MAVKALSRLEANKEVRRILVRHSIDMTKIQFSCQGKNLVLAGGIFKDNGEELDAAILECVMQELGRVGIRVSGDLENWAISEGTITKKGGSLKVAKQQEVKKTIVVDVAKTATDKKLSPEEQAAEDERQRKKKAAS